MSALDLKFAKIVALMNSTQHAGERAAARARADAVAAACGMTFDQALAAMSKTPPAGIVNIFAGFDDWMEEREPGYKAARSAERTEKERARLVRKAAIIKRYGSEEAALAPCAREQMIHSALGKRIKYGPRPHQRWTYEVDGCTSAWHGLKPAARQGVANAYPLPTTFAAAREEYDYWRHRRDEMEDVLGDFGDCGLDMTAEIRMDIVRDLAERDLPVTTIVDLHARFAMYRASESNDNKIEAALFRDLEAIMHAAEHPSDVSTAATGTHILGIPEDHPSTSVRDAAAMLRADPDCSDRHVARACGCSPTTVGKIRRSLGLEQGPRSVQRGGQTYRMRVAAQQGAAL